MGLFAAILGSIGGLFAVIGIIKALGIIPDIIPQLTWELWLATAAILLLGSIATSVGHNQDYE